ncbi:DUF4097 family beta strand repeat-containing protein [Lysinibacillus sp. 54212]|uniref:DUF4097 family beta strand repeat-containing protein n=1 Tax=Lysinibacillus sp. 54212 TaxID=3119829 RepID=UPI002FC9AE03
MTEQGFLQQLERALLKLNETEKKDIIRDFTEYFASGRAEGKQTSEMIAALGSPEELAVELLKVYSEDEFVQVTHLEQEDDVKHVVIKSDQADIRILPSPTGKVYTELSEKADQTRVDIEREQDTLKITIRAKESKFKILGISFIFSKDSHSVVTIYLPEKLYETMNVKSDQGEISIEHLQMKQLSVRSDQGRTELRHILARETDLLVDTGRIVTKDCNFTAAKLKTDTGRIVVKRSKAERWNLETDTGRIVLKHAGGEISARTDTGRIIYESQAVTSPIHLKTDTGNIELLTTEPLQNATVKAKTDMGKIMIYGDKKRTAVFGDGALPISLKTDMGNISIKMIKEEILM